MGKLKDVLLQSAKITGDIGKHCRKGGYATEVYNICGVTPPPPEEHHESIESLKTIVQGM